MANVTVVTSAIDKSIYIITTTIQKSARLFFSLVAREITRL